jgi:hypothetical protein
VPLFKPKKFIILLTLGQISNIKLPIISINKENKLDKKLNSKSPPYIPIPDPIH